VLRTVAIVGASLGGLRAAECLRRAGFEGRLLLVGEEEALPYDRPPLSKQYLRGEWDEERIQLRSADELAALDLSLELGTRATALDVENRRLELSTGKQVGFDAAVLATGAATWRPVGWDLAGVHDLRTLADAQELSSAMACTERLVVIGAGFIGCEVAATARQRGLEVDLVEALEVPLARSLGALAGSYCAKLQRAHGVRVHAGTAVDQLIGRNGHVRAVRLANGETLACDLVVVGLGVRPATDWLVDSGLEIADGIVCDERCAAAPGIYAVGDVARWPHQGERVRVEHWTNTAEQAAYVARCLLAGESEVTPFTSVPYFWSDQYDVKLQGAGLASPTDHAEILAGSPNENRFVLGYRRGDHLSAVLTASWPRMLGALRRLLVSRPTWDAAVAQVDALLAGASDRQG
jgi:NADPH-dependent 2,4-dienoyl-CoA reductase/sulfur reductase-like enzyme